MKVLFDHHLPFALAHGGFEQQLAQTKAALERVGVETDYVRWWDASQRGDIIHFAGRPSVDYIAFAHGCGRKVVLAELLTATGSRTRRQLALQKVSMNGLPKILPGNVRRAAGLGRLPPRRRLRRQHRLGSVFDELSFRRAEGTRPRRAQRCRGSFFGFAKSRARTSGSSAPPPSRNASARWNWPKPPLLPGRRCGSSANPIRIPTFTRKNSSRWRNNSRKSLRYEGAIQDRARLARIYREARGFVLLSAMETRSLSAEEAAACECPLLLSDLPWAHSAFWRHRQVLSGDEIHRNHGPRLARIL